MPLQPLLPRRLYRQIAEQLRALIEHGEFPAGTRLPPERDLAVQLGVSRPSVREALIALEVEGRVEVRMGSGIYVREAPVRAAAVEHEAESPLETIRARALIEGELAAVAARQMKRAQLAGWRAAGLIVDAAYGNASTDLTAYLGAGLPADALWIIGPHGGEQGLAREDAPPSGGDGGHVAPPRGRPDESLTRSDQVFSASRSSGARGCRYL